MGGWRCEGLRKRRLRLNYALVDLGGDIQTKGLLDYLIACIIEVIVRLAIGSDEKVVDVLGRVHPFGNIFENFGHLLIIDRFFKLRLHFLFDKVLKQVHVLVKVNWNRILGICNKY